LTQAHKRAQRNNTWVAVLFLDIDEFKSINDTYGHRTGDAVLQAFGAKLRGAVRDADVVARFGGDEFTILLDDLKSPDAIQTVVTKIESSLAVPAEVGAYQLTLRASIGAATARGAETVPEKLLAEADSSMYQAKTRRRPGLLKPQTSEAALREVAEEAANGDIARNPSSRH
jgi:diguanylate cyclase (GGDEF)-like protein